jgi:transcriptional regulator with XRE-family HTH domain
MGKKVKFTGSKLLGQELRRLRGDRSLDQVAEMTRTGPLAERVGPVAAPTLSQIETGTSFPSVATLHSLATLYQTSVQRLLDVVVQERLVQETEPTPDDHDAVRGLFREAFEAGKWRQALGLAVRGEALASTPGERVSWRANRAICLQHFGLRHDAIQVLLDCTSDPEAPRDRLYQLYRALAEALASAGQVGPAAAIASRAVELAPSDLPPHWRWQLLSTRARLVLLDNTDRTEPDRAAVARALQDIETARELAPADQPQARLLLGVQQAIARKIMGDVEMAAGELSALLADAHQRGQALAEVAAGLALGRLHREFGDLEAAERVLTSAERVAVEEGFVEDAFEAYFELHLVSKAKGDNRFVYFLRRCRRYYPLVQVKAPHVLAYEKLMRAEA